MKGILVIASVLAASAAIAAAPSAGAHCTWMYGPGSFNVIVGCVGFMSDGEEWCTGFHSDWLNIHCAGIYGEHGSGSQLLLA